MKMEKNISEMSSVQCKGNELSSFANELNAKVSVNFDSNVSNKNFDSECISYSEVPVLEHFHIHFLSTGNENCASSSKCSWACEFCDRRYSRRQSLIEHTRNHTGTDFPCPLCEKRFTIQSKLNAHFKIHTKQKDHFCLYCSKSFTDRGTLVEHTKLHTGQKNHKCQYCGKTFVQKGVYLAHLKLHTGLNLWSCEYCGKKFNRKSSLVLHIRRHTGNLLSCNLCNTEFSVRSKLISHMKNHGGIKEYKCNVCDRSYVEKNSLHQHYQIHTRGKISCQICSNSFTKKSSLDRHMLLHSEKKPFECPICQKQYIQQIHLQTHLTRKHADSPHSPASFLCHYCGKSYQHKHSLSTHIRTHEATNHENLTLANDGLNTNIEPANDQRVESDENCVESSELANGDNASVASEDSGVDREEDDARYHMENSVEILPLNIPEIKGFEREEINILTGLNPEAQLSELLSILVDLTGISFDLTGKPPTMDSFQPQPLFGIQPNRCTIDPSVNGGVHEAVNDLSDGDFEAESDHFCCVCDLQFMSKDELDSHVRKHYEDKTIICSYCSKVFKSVSRLKVHVVSHEERPLHRCHICGRDYRYKHSLAQHMSLHSGLKPYRCSYQDCHKKFTKKISLDRHVMSHTGARPFPCSHCKRSFAQKSQLMIHVRIHTGEKPFLCAFCGKRFSRKDSLTIHLRTHTLKHFLTEQLFQVQNQIADGN